MSFFPPAARAICRFPVPSMPHFAVTNGHHNGHQQLSRLSRHKQHSLGGEGREEPSHEYPHKPHQLVIEAADGGLV